MKKIYHTALSKGSITYDGVPSTAKALHPRGVLMQNDIIINGLPSEFNDCDVLYAEPPWPHGFQIFNKRAGASHTSYADLGRAIRNIIETYTVPIYILLGKRMLQMLPEPDQLIETILNGNSATVAVWKDKYNGPVKNTEHICNHLGSRYECLGDFTCGYGACVKNFLEGGGSKFVASDYDGKCITVMAAQLKSVE